MSSLAAIKAGIADRAEQGVIDACFAAQNVGLPKQNRHHWNAALMEGLIQGLARVIVGTTKPGHEVPCAKDLADSLVAEVHRLMCAGEA